MDMIGIVLGDDRSLQASHCLVTMYSTKSWFEIGQIFYSTQDCFNKLCLKFILLLQTDIIVILKKYRDIYIV